MHKSPETPRRNISDGSHAKTSFWFGLNCPLFCVNKLHRCRCKAVVVFPFSDEEDNVTCFLSLQIPLDLISPVVVGTAHALYIQGSDIVGHEVTQISRKPMNLPLFFLGIFVLELWFNNSSV